MLTLNHSHSNEKSTTCFRGGRCGVWRNKTNGSLVPARLCYVLNHDLVTSLNMPPCRYDLVTSLNMPPCRHGVPTLVLLILLVCELVEGKELCHSTPLGMVLWYLLILIDDQTERLKHTVFHRIHNQRTNQPTNQATNLRDSLFTSVFVLHITVPGVLLSIHVLFWVPKLIYSILMIFLLIGQTTWWATF